MTRCLTAQDIMPMDDYQKERPEIRQKMRSLKNKRRFSVGPYASVMFESYDTIWHQVHEMLFIEQGGQEQISSELEVYNPLMPSSHSLTFTLMFEMEDSVKRLEFLKLLSHVEEYFYLHWGNAEIQAYPIDSQDRTRKDGKTSAVHFMSFVFDESLKSSFLSFEDDVGFSINHPCYHHTAILPKTLQLCLKKDLSEE